MMARLARKFIFLTILKQIWPTVTFLKPWQAAAANLGSSELQQRTKYNKSIQIDAQLAPLPHTVVAFSKNESPLLRRSTIIKYATTPHSSTRLKKLKYALLSP
jgi:hypothetical protein